MKREFITLYSLYITSGSRLLALAKLSLVFLFYISFFKMAVKRGLVFLVKQCFDIYYIYYKIILDSAVAFLPVVVWVPESFLWSNLNVNLYRCQ